MNGDHPKIHQPRKFASILSKRVYDHAWRIRFFDKDNRVVVTLDPYVLHGPDPSDNGLAEIKKMAWSTMRDNPSMNAVRFGVSYLGTL